MKKLIIPALALLVILGCCKGCASVFRSPVQQLTDQVIGKIEQLKPETAAVQGGGNVINPTGIGQVEVIAGTIVRVTTKVGTEGVAGQVSVASQATDAPPTTQPTTQPAEE